MKTKKRLADSFSYVFLSVLGFVVVFPILYAILGSFKSNQEVTLGGTIFPKEWIFTNYIEAFEKYDFFLYTYNSFYIAIMVTLLALIVSSMAGYCFARKEFRFKKLLFNAYLATMFVSVGSLTLKPLYLLMVDLNLHRSLWAVILVDVGAQGANIFLVSRFVKSLPRELDEAAVIEGCNSFQIYYKIILPLIKPILGVVGLFSFRGAWNNYIMANVFTMTSPELRPLSVVVVSMRYDTGAATEWSMMLTGATISVIPMLIVYAFANKQFMSGMVAGAVKG